MPARSGRGDTRPRAGGFDDRNLRSRSRGGWEWEVGGRHGGPWCRPPPGWQGCFLLCPRLAEPLPVASPSEGAGPRTWALLPRPHPNLTTYRRSRLQTEPHGGRGPRVGVWGRHSLVHSSERPSLKRFYEKMSEQKQNNTKTKKQRTHCMRVYVGRGKVRNKNTIITQKNLILCFYLNEVSVTLTTLEYLPFALVSTCHFGSS